MATRAETARAQEQRRRHTATKKQPSRTAAKKTARARKETEAEQETSGHFAGGTAERNVKLDRGESATFDLEDSATGKPSRKSTRKAANRAKPDTNLRRRQMRANRSPERRAETSAARSKKPRAKTPRPGTRAS